MFKFLTVATCANALVAEFSELAFEENESLQLLQVAAKKTQPNTP